MTIPIQPPAPVNTVITIQPVATAIPNRDSAPGANPLATLPAGTTVEGFVVNRDAQNNPILRTPLGDLRITSDVFLKTGSEVVFRVDTSQASLARIVTVDGLSPQEYSAQSSRGLTQDTISSSALAPPSANALAQTAKTGFAASNAPVLNAIVLQPSAQLPPQQAPSLLAAALSAAQSGPASVLTQLSQLRTGASLKLTVLDLKLPPLPVALANLPESSALSQLLPPRSGGANPPSAPSNPTVLTSESAQTTPAATVNLNSPSSPEVKAAAASQVSSSSPAPLDVPKALPPSATPVAQATTAADASRPNSAPALSPPNTTLASHAYTNTTAAATQPRSESGAAQVLRNNLPSGANAANAVANGELTKPTAENQIVANVIGHDADGANILHTPFASLKVYTPQPLPTGTSLLLQADIKNGDSFAPAIVEKATPAATAPALNSQLLSGLRDTLQWLNANQPEVARDAQTRLPTLSHQLASGLLSYIAGIKGGDVADIIGKRATRLLEINAPELLARLRNPIEAIQDNLVDVRTGQWTSLPLPLLFSGELHIAQLYVGKEASDSETSSPDKARGQRFILEVEMSQLGPLQFDGFVRSLDKTKSFDLMVRSNSPLPADIDQGIRTIFTNAIEVTGMRGQVLFQQGSHHFIRPEASAKRVLGDDTKTILA